MDWLPWANESAWDGLYTSADPWTMALFCAESTTLRGWYVAPFLGEATGPGGWPRLAL